MKKAWLLFLVMLLLSPFIGLAVLLSALRMFWLIGWYFGESAVKRLITDNDEYSAWKMKVRLKP